MKFDWDAGKAQKNLEKHGITFELATLAFFDPNAAVVEDSRHDCGEDRFVIFGRIADRLYAVVDTKNETSGSTRIISARKARRRERKEHDNC